MTVLLARNRQPPTTVAAGVPHAELAVELITLPSGLLAMVCEAIVKLKVRLGRACLGVRGCVCVQLCTILVRMRVCVCGAGGGGGGVVLASRGGLTRKH